MVYTTDTAKAKYSKKFKADARDAGETLQEHQIKVMKKFLEEKGHNVTVKKKGRSRTIVTATRDNPVGMFGSDKYVPKTSDPVDRARFSTAHKKAVKEELERRNHKRAGRSSAY